MARAKRLAIEERYLKVLRQNVEAWKFAKDLGAYTDDVRRQLFQWPASHDAGNIEAWLRWASEFLGRCDSMDSFPEFPVVEGEPTIKELEEHLGGLSPYGP